MYLVLTNLNMYLLCLLQKCISDFTSLDAVFTLNEKDTVRAPLLPALDLKPLSIINRGFLGSEKFQCNINRSAI